MKERERERGRERERENECQKEREREIVDVRTLAQYLHREDAMKLAPVRFQEYSCRQRAGDACPCIHPSVHTTHVHAFMHAYLLTFM